MHNKCVRSLPTVQTVHHCETQYVCTHINAEFSIAMVHILRRAGEDLALFSISIKSKVFEDFDSLVNRPPSPLCQTGRPHVSL